MATAPDTITADATPAPDTPAEPVDLAQEMYGEPANDPAPAPEGDEPAEKPEGEESEPKPDPEPEGDPIEAPVSWAKDYKEQFASLPRPMQEIIAKRETEREQFVQAKSREAAATRQTVESEATNVIQRLYQNHAAELEGYARQFDVAPPDIRLLQSGDPQHHAIYNEQDRAYRLATAQRDQVTQQAQAARQRAEAVEQQQQQQALAEEVAVLTEKVPEWSDPSARAKLLTDLEPIAAELGYTAEAIAQARAMDIIALKQAHGWRDKARRYDDLMKRKMEPVRAARQIPPVSRTGSPAGQAQSVDTAALLYPDDVRRR